MNTKGKYFLEREDFVKALSASFNSNNIGCGKDDVIALLDSYSNYIEAVVKHTVYSYEFKNGNGYDPSARQQMEELNGKRSAAHDDAIKKTLSYSQELLKYHGVIFNSEFVYKDDIKDFNNAQRVDFGDFIFRTVATASSLSEQEIQAIGTGVDLSVLRNLDRRIDKLSRDYDVEITDDQSKIYESAVRSSDDFLR